MKRGWDDPLFTVKQRKSHRGLVIVLLLLLIFVLITGLINAFVNRQVQVVQQSVTIPSLPGGLQNFRILHLSDLHGAYFGKNQEGIASAIRNLRYNIVVITGDSTGQDGDFTALTEVLELIDGQVPVFLVAGDEDPPAIQTTARINRQVKAEYVLAAEKMGAIYLDAPYRLAVNRSTNLWLCPDSLYSSDIENTRQTLEYNLKVFSEAEQTEDTQAAVKAFRYRLDVLAKTEQALAEMKSTDIKLLVTHIPYSESNIGDLMYQEGAGLINNARPVSLVLCGHYVNGQWRIPLAGPVFVPASLGLYPKDTWFPEQRRLAGLRAIRGISQYISPGLGASGLYHPFRFRFMNSPCVTLLTLTNKLVSP